MNCPDRPSVIKKVCLKVEEKQRSGCDDRSKVRVVRYDRESTLL